MQLPAVRIILSSLLNLRMNPSLGSDVSKPGLLPTSFPKFSTSYKTEKGYEIIFKTLYVFNIWIIQIKNFTKYYNGKSDAIIL